MNKDIRKNILKCLNSGDSANNIYNNIAYIIYNKRIYNRIGFDYSLYPSDFKSNAYIQILQDIEKIIKVYEWDKKKILFNLNSWIGLK